MKGTLCFILCIAFIAGISFSLVGQNNIRFSNINYENGLSQNSVFAMAQDKDGFIWFGTAEGLNCYDGYTFQIFRPDLYDSTAISDTWITALYTASDGKIWVGTFGGGVNIFDKKTEKFRSFKNIPGNPNSLCNDFIYSIAEDKMQRIWIGTDFGISVFNCDNEKFIHYSHDKNNNKSLSHNAVNFIYCDREGRIWVCTDGGGLNLFDSVIDGFVNFNHNSNNIQTIASNSVWQICEDNVVADVFWIATFNGLDKFDLNKNTFIHFNTGTAQYQLPDNKIRTLLDDNKNRIWLGTQDKGLCYLDKKTLQIYHFTNQESDSRSLSNNQILSIMQDNSGLIWVGTRGGGVDKILESNFSHLYCNKDNKNSLVSNVVWSIFEQDRIIWIGTNNGLSRFDLNNSTFKHFQKSTTNASINDDNIYALFVDADGDLWIGTSEGGLNLLRKNANHFEYLLPNPENANSLSHSYVRSITQDKDGIIWIGTRGGGVCTYNKISKTFTRFRNEQGNTGSLSHNRVNVVYVDFDNNVWVGTSGGGLNKYDREKNQFIHYTNNPLDMNSLSDIYVLSINQSHDSILWIGTYNGGLNAFNTRTGVFKHYTVKDGLPNNVVYGILEDANNNLWISTNRGLCRFKPGNGEIKTFNVSDGIQGLEFNTGAAHKGKSGNMYFGGTDGLTVFRPDEISENRFIPPVYITGIKLSDQSLLFGRSTVLKKAVIYSDTIEMNYNQNNFSFTFSSLHYHSPQKNQYAYILEDYENQWTQIGNVNFARYTNVPPGRYVFKVKGCNSDGIWNFEPASMVVIIHPPFWKTLWFKILVVSFIILSIYLIIIIREQNLRRAKRKLIEKVKERTAEIQKQKEEIEAQRDEIQRQRDFVAEQNQKILEKNEILFQQKEEIQAQAELLAATNIELEKLSIVASKTNNAILIADKNGDIEWANEAFVKLYGYSLYEFISRRGGNIESASVNPEIHEALVQVKNQKKPAVYTTQANTRDGNKIWIQTTLSPVLNNNGELQYIIAVDANITQIKLAEKEIARKNKDITDSIRYASRMQEALKPSAKFFHAVFPEHFIINLPRDIVSGDFYFLTYRKPNAFLALADCTGHGVPGAFMSILGIAFLKEIINYYHITNADEILNRLRNKIINALHQSGKEGETSDGIDMAICVFDLKEKTLQYAGANKELILIRNRQLTEFKPDNFPIGIHEFRSKPFTSYQVDLENGDMLYLASDGFVDQFGGPEGKKYLSKRFKEKLVEISSLPVSEQKELLTSAFLNWKNNNAQVDDVLILGIKIV